MYCLELSCHSNNLIKSSLLGALTCIPTVGKMSFIMGLNSVKSQSTGDLQKSEIANLRNLLRSTNTISNGCEKLGFCPHLPFPITTTSISTFQTQGLQLFRNSFYVPITPLSRAFNVPLFTRLLLPLCPYKQGMANSSAHPNSPQHRTPAPAAHNSFISSP